MRNRFLRPMGVVALAMSLSSMASATGEGHDPRAVVQHIFDVADIDQDGSLTRAEYDAAGLERFGVSFDACDANADGATSMAEYLELYEAHHPPAGSSEI